jgi:leader peptidase (prepilin peptidase)/N-methyltransferase
MSWFLDTAAATGLYGLFVGLLVPDIIARVPEPSPAEPTAVEEGAAGQPSVADETDEPKELYAAIAARRGLRWKTALATALVGALVGARVGWSSALFPLLYLAPVGVALAVIALSVAAAWSAGDWSPLVTAAWGWLVAGGTFFLLWFIYPRGMGYGDVRLSGVLGIALGYLGWAELLTGVYAGFLIGGLGGFLLARLRIVDRKAYPFGPFMLIGAVVGILAGPGVAAWYV